MKWEKETITTILAFLILSLTSFGIIINAIHFVQIRKTTEIDLESVLISINDTLEKNVELLEQIKVDEYNGNLDEESFILIYNTIETNLTNIENLSFLKEEKSKFSNKDKYLMLEEINNSIPISDLVNSFKIIATNDNSLEGIEDIITSNIIMSIRATDTIFLRLLNNFSYYTGNYIEYSLNTPDSAELYIITTSIQNTANMVNFLTTWLLNDMDGDLNG